MFEYTIYYTITVIEYNYIILFSTIICIVYMSWNGISSLSVYRREDNICFFGNFGNS